MMFSLKKLANSLRNALRGLKVVFKEEQSFRAQALTAIVVVVLMFILPVSNLERSILFLAIGAVLGLETLNSQLEKMLDFLQPNHDLRVKRIKDLSAAAVLIASLTSFVIGILIFLPHLI